MGTRWHKVCRRAGGGAAPCHSNRRMSCLLVHCGGWHLEDFSHALEAHKPVGQVYTQTAGAREGRWVGGSGGWRVIANACMVRRMHARCISLQCLQCLQCPVDRWQGPWGQHQRSTVHTSAPPLSSPHTLLHSSLFAARTLLQVASEEVGDQLAARRVRLHLQHRRAGPGEGWRGGRWVRGIWR